MKTSRIVVSLGLLLAASGCSGVLGIETDSTLVACNDKSPCPNGQACTDNRCLPSTGATAQTGGASSGGTNVTGGAGGVTSTSSGGTSGAVQTSPIGSAGAPSTATRSGQAGGAIGSGDAFTAVTNSVGTTATVGNATSGGAQSGVTIAFISGGATTRDSAGGTSSDTASASGGHIGTGMTTLIGGTSNGIAATSRGRMGTAGDANSTGGETSITSGGTSNGSTASNTGGGETRATSGGAADGGTAAVIGGGSTAVPPAQGGQTASGGGSAGGLSSSGGTMTGGTSSCAASVDDGIGECIPGTHRCHVPENTAGNPVYWQTCGTDCTWNTGTYCSQYCTTAKGCANAPSCENIAATPENLSCCASVPIKGGKFNRSTTVVNGAEYCTRENPCPATLGHYSLDIYEVTIGRFRNFVRHYSQNMTVSGTGSNAKIRTDTGWDGSWNTGMPADSAALERDLQSCEQSTYTDEPMGREFLPIGCVNWYLALAFCIWDGGRLPTELEWDYAASGGEARVYPWSIPPENPLVSTEYAVYTPFSQFVTLTAPDNVASRRKGVARWGQYDLAGNIAEWVTDAYEDLFVTANPCTDCANLDRSNPLRVARGGAYPNDESLITSSSRMSAVAGKPLTWQGFRCARDL